MYGNQSKEKGPTQQSETLRNILNEIEGKVDNATEVQKKIAQLSDEFNRISDVYRNLPGEIPDIVTVTPFPNVRARTQIKSSKIVDESGNTIGYILLFNEGEEQRISDAFTNLFEVPDRRNSS